MPTTSTPAPSTVAQPTNRMRALIEQLPLEWAGVRLRELRLRDAERLGMGAADPLTQRWAYLQEDDTSPEAMRQRIQQQYRDEAAQGEVVRLAITEPGSDHYLGLLAFFAEQSSDSERAAHPKGSEPAHSVEIGFVVTPDQRGAGVAGRALAAGAELARRAGYGVLRARTDVENTAAQRTLEAAQYRPVGEPAPPRAEHLQHVRLQEYRRLLTSTGTSTSMNGGSASAHDPASELQKLLETLVRDTGIPGAQAAIVQIGGVTGDGGVAEGGAGATVMTRSATTAAAGVLSTRTQLPVTTDAIFQIGSITKLVTTVLVLQLVDDGLIRLDDAVADHVPEFQLSDAAFTRRVRIIDLLQHRGGFDGDIFTDGGRGLDAPQAIIAELAGAEIFSAPGEQFAYSNAGMVVLGRLIELTRGGDYLSVVRERIYRPLGLEHAVTLPEEAILHPVAMGHTRDADGAAIVMPSWQLPMSAAATGAALTMSAENLARFGEMLARGGRTNNGERLLSAEMAQVLVRRAFSLPAVSPIGEGFATGAFTYRYDGAHAYGHDGQTIGQVAALRVLPEVGVVVAVTTNRENATELTEAVIDFALQRFCGARVAAPQALPDPPLAPERELIEGSYANHTLTATVTVDGHEAYLQLGARGIELGNQPAMRLHRVGDGVYRVTAAEHGVDLTFVFTGAEGSGSADFVWFARMLRRV